MAGILSNIRSSRSLREELSQISLEEQFVLVSFDLVALFTSIHVTFAIETIERRWAELDGIHTAIKEDTFFDILSFCLKNGYCQFESVFSQVHGVAMGNPLSPIIADLVLDQLFILVHEKFQDKVKYGKNMLTIVYFIFITLFWTNFLNF